MNVPGADGAHHVVAATAGDQRLRVDAQTPGDIRQNSAHWLVRFKQLGQRVAQVATGINVFE